jgi:hypothetical protein
MLKSHNLNAALLCGVATIVYGHAVVSERHCAAHPQSQHCENPAVLKPDFPDGPESPRGPGGLMGTVLIQPSSTGTLTGPTGMFTR